MDKILIKDIFSGIVERRLPFIDDIFPLLHYDTKRSIKSAVQILKTALMHYEENFMIKQRKVITVHYLDEGYTFTNTYPNYLAGEIFEHEIELVPRTLHTVTRGVQSIARNFWTYRKPLFKGLSGEIITYGFCEHPVIIEFDDQGFITDDSHIYGIENPMQFEHQVDYDFLNEIKSRTHQVNLPMTIDFLSLDNTISDLKEQVDEDRSTSSDIYDTWR